MTAEECRARRLALGLTRYELARTAGLVERTVARFEDGLAQPRSVTLIALRKALRHVEAAGRG